MKVSLVHYQNVKQIFPFQKILLNIFPNKTTKGVLHILIPNFVNENISIFKMKFLYVLSYLILSFWLMIALPGRARYQPVTHTEGFVAITPQGPLN